VKHLRNFLDVVKFEHTIFALPFAYLGMLLAARGLPTFHDFFWITAAMAGARTVAFAVNRWADRFYDARNPRTQKRALPEGRVSPRMVLIYAVAGGLVLMVAAALLDPLAVRLLPLALAFLIGYSFTKRFTVAAHWVLGLTDAMAPAGAWVAVRGSLFTPEDYPAWLLALAVTTWIAGFDLLYACQDVEFDREEGLHAWPARYGVTSALNMAAANHVVTVAMLILLDPAADLGPIYLIAVGTAAALLWYEHRLVHPEDLSQIDRAFFNMNAIIALVLLAGTFAALMMKRSGL
jgi:4-hydroxybenzoate polyprenyltransferase